MKPTKYYYFNEGTRIYYGNDVEYTFFKSMDRYPVREVEQEVERLNKQAKLVAPAGDIDWEEE